MVGIYQILNIKNGKIYIGKSSDIKKRFKTHLSNLKHKKHINKSLQNDFNIYGEEAFRFNVLILCPHAFLDRNESLLCHTLDVWNKEKGYNIAKLLDYNIITHEDAVTLKQAFINKLLKNNKEILTSKNHSTLEVEWIADQMQVTRDEMLIALKEIDYDDGNEYDLGFTLSSEYEKHNLIIVNRKAQRDSLIGFKL